MKGKKNIAGREERRSQRNSPNSCGKAASSEPSSNKKVPAHAPLSPRETLNKPNSPSAIKPLPKSHIDVAVEKAIVEVRHLNGYTGEARKDLFDGIVDLLTEAFVKDVDDFNLERQTTEITLSTRDESISQHEKIPTHIKTEPATHREPNASTLSNPTAKRSTAEKKDNHSTRKVAAQKIFPEECTQEAPETRASKKRSEIVEDLLDKEPPTKKSNRARERRTSQPSHPAQNTEIFKTSKSPNQDNWHAVNSSRVLKIKGGRQKPPDSPPEVPFIEESVVDGGAAIEVESRRSKGKRNPSKRAQHLYTEVVIDSSEHDLHRNVERSKNQILNAKQRRPWWRASDSLVTLSTNEKNEYAAMKSFVMAVIRSCIRESWNADALKESFYRDRASSRGKAFMIVSSSLFMMQRARHLDQCYMKWRPIVLKELSERRVIEWSRLEKHVSFDHFAGCDVCLGQREATARLWLRGQPYDSGNFWPGCTRFETSVTEDQDPDFISIAVKRHSGTKNDHIVRTHAEAPTEDTELWVDSQCLRKCLLFHELSHATAIIAENLRVLVGDELRDGVVHLDMRNSMRGDDSVSLRERLEGYLVQAVTGNREFLKRRAEHLVEILRLGDIYFSAEEEELIDSGNCEASWARKTPKTYDPPLVLNDEEYHDRIERIVSLAQKRDADASSAMLL